VNRPADLRWDAVVLAGGRARRLGGVVKPLVRVGDRTLLDAAMSAAAGADRVVVVGEVPVPPGVLQTLEEPPHGGPAAGLAAGVAALGPELAPWTLVLAGDLPESERAVPLVLAAAQAAAADPAVDGVCLQDAEGRPQWLLAAYRSERLRSVLAAATRTRDLSMRRLLAPLRLRPLAADPEVVADCDTWEDVATARARALRGGAGGRLRDSSAPDPRVRTT
jgi:molybdopterin-guanine dinucleotide biosynthesis protein A